MKYPHSIERRNTLGLETGLVWKRVIAEREIPPGKEAQNLRGCDSRRTLQRLRQQLRLLSPCSCKHRRRAP